MKTLSNAHTHTTHCDGKSTAAEQVAAAQALGFVSLGFSGHAMQGFDWLYCMSVEGQRAYREELLALRESLRQSGSALRLWIGVEQDSLVPEVEKAANRELFEYRIGSTHYFPEPLDGAWVAVDGSAELLTRFIAERFDGDATAMAQAYFALHGQAVERDRPEIVGHFDLVRKYAAGIGLDVHSRAYRDAALAALAQARKGCGVLEVNTGNIARGYDTHPYPADFLLDAWRDLDGELTLTSDCHNARDLDCAFAPTMEHLRALGWTRLLRLGTGEALWEEVRL